MYLSDRAWAELDEKKLIYRKQKLMYLSDTAYRDCTLIKDRREDNAGITGP